MGKDIYHELHSRTIKDREENNKIFIYFLYKENEVPFYIGKSVGLDYRYSKHKTNYGLDTKIEILDIVSENDWKFWEEYYIRLFKSWGFELKNKNYGGGGCPKGVIFSEERSIKISKANKGKSKSHKGRSFSEEHKQKIKETRNFLKNRKITWGDKISKSILQYDLKENFIREFKSIYEANNFLGVKRPERNGQIGRCANGHIKTSYGYIWKFKK